MKSLIAAVLCVFLPVSALAEAAGYKVAYDGGSIPQKAGTSMYLYIETNQIRLAQKSEVLATIPSSAVTEISYGQDVHRRVGTAIGLAFGFVMVQYYDRKGHKRLTPQPS